MAPAVPPLALRPPTLPGHGKKPPKMNLSLGTESIQQAETTTFNMATPRQAQADVGRHYIGTPRATSILSAFLDFGEAELDLDADEGDCAPPLDFDEAMAALEAANAAPTLDVKVQAPNADDCDSSKSTRWSESDRTPYAQTNSCFSMCDGDDDEAEDGEADAGHCRSVDLDPEKEGSEASDGEEYEEEYDSDFESESEYDSGSEDEGEQPSTGGSAAPSGTATGSDSLNVARRARSSSRAGRTRSSSRANARANSRANSRANPRASSRSGLRASTQRNFPSASELLGQSSSSSSAALPSASRCLPPALPAGPVSGLTFNVPLPPSKGRCPEAGNSKADRKEEQKEEQEPEAPEAVEEILDTENGKPESSR